MSLTAASRAPPRPPSLQAPKPSAGPHKTRECLPLILLLRNRLKYALTGKEVTSILMQRLVEVDGKVRTDKTYPVGFMDVVDIPKTGEAGLCGWEGGKEGVREVAEKDIAAAVPAEPAGAPSMWSQLGGGRRQPWAWLPA